MHVTFANENPVSYSDNRALVCPSKSILALGQIFSRKSDLTGLLNSMYLVLYHAWDLRGMQRSVHLRAQQ
jgi:hypothetical protein